MFRQARSNRKAIRAQRIIDSAIAEPLESRRLLAGIEAGVLVARGTAGADVISVRRHLTDDVIVTTNGVDQQFDMDDFSGVRLEGLAGNDTFQLIDPLVSPVVRNTTILGGAGSDTLSFATRTAALNLHIDPSASSMTSGAETVSWNGGVETVTAGSGSDTFHYGNVADIPNGQEDLEFNFRMEGRGGNDSFSDGIGDNNNFGVVSVLGGDGNDSFGDDEFGQKFQFGEAGDDAFAYVNLADVKRTSGGAGIDSVTYQTFNSTLDLRQVPDIENVTSVSGAVSLIIGNELSNHIAINNDGDVSVQGLGGNDTLEGGEGDDSLVGGFGDDFLDGGDGIDVGDGGPGNDTLVNIETQPGPGSIGRVGRTLIADGSWGQDRITIERTGADNVIVRVNEVSREFDIDDFDSVLLRGNAGYDDIRVLDPVRTSLITRQVRLLGGAGNDVLFGSEGGTESLDGGDGVDFLEVRDGFGGDTAIGGNGNDAAQVDPGDTTSGIENFG